MIRTFAVLATDLLDDEKRRAWDEKMCAYEALLEQVQQHLSRGKSKVCDGLKIAQSSHAVGGVSILSFSIAKLTRSHLQGQPPEISRLDVAEFEQACEVVAAGMVVDDPPELSGPPPSGPRILSRP